MNDIELSRAQRDLRDRLSKYCAETFDLELEQFDAEFFVDFIAKELGPLFYNAGIEEAIRTHQAWSERIREEMDLKRSINTAYRRRRSIKPCIHHGYNGDSFSISVYGEGKPCRLSPIYPPFLTSSQKLARRAFSPSWILKSRTYRWWALTAPLCPEIAMAAGAVVVSLCSTSDETIEEAEKISRATSARLSKAATASAKPINVPTSISLTRWLGNHLRRQKKMYEYMAEFKAVHVMQLPNSASDAASRALWKTEILRLQQVIEARFGTPISEAALREAIVLKNRERRALAHFYRLGQLNPPALSGGDILKVVYGATFRFDKTALIDELHAMAERIHQEWQQGKRLEPRPRILITGCPIGGAAEKVVRAIEENGGWVVGYENCTGAKATERCVAEEGDVYDALTDKYLAIGCSCISPTTSVCSC